MSKLGEVFHASARKIVRFEAESPAQAVHRRRKEQREFRHLSQVGVRWADYLERELDIDDRIDAEEALRDSEVLRSGVQQELLRGPSIKVEFVLLDGRFRIDAHRVTRQNAPKKTNLQLGITHPVAEG